MDKSIIDTFQKFADDNQTELEFNEGKYIMADETVLNIQTKDSINFQFKEKRSHTISYHNKINRFIVLSPLNKRTASVDTITVQTKSNLAHKIKVLFSSSYRNSKEKHFKTYPKKNQFVIKITKKSYFKEFLTKYNFLKLTFSFKENELYLKAQNLSSVPYIFLKEIHQFVNNLKRDL